MKKIVQWLSLFICFLVGSIHAMLIKPFNVEARDKYALYGDFSDIKDISLALLAGHRFEGYGFKTANLVELEKIADFLNSKVKKSYRVAVPSFVGISSREVKRMLNAMGLDVDLEWKKLVEAHYPGFQIKDPVFKPGFLKELKRLAERIKMAFVTNASQAEHIFEANLEFKNFTKLKELINKAGVQRLMARSTGREDTKELANAGGNESIPNVKAELTEIFKAMGAGAKSDQYGVVSSYFGEKSMKQRLGAKDSHLLDLPLIPVLVQVMIGEKDGGEAESSPEKITRCGVLYTEEPDGSLYKITEGKAFSGLTLIQGSYGHNEGVVNSIVPVDSYYVDEIGKIYSIVRPKTFRLVPTEESRKSTEGSVRSQEQTDPKIIYRPALDKNVIQKLKILAAIIQKYYDYPMDVEYVVDVEHQTINLVQARPIVIPDTDSATYIKDIDTYKKFIKIDDIIVASGGALRFITSSDQIIAERTINQALVVYQSLKAPQLVKCILIEEQAPATSHEAATFRGEGKPVICIRQMSEIEPLIQAIEKGTGKFVIDVQQGKIIEWAGEEQSIQNLLENSLARKGWISYPIARVVSLVPPFPPGWEKELSTVGVELWKGEESKDKISLLHVAKFYNIDDLRKLDFRFFVNQIRDAKTVAEKRKALGGLLIFIQSIAVKIPSSLKDLYSTELKLLLRFIVAYSIEINRVLSKEGFDSENQTLWLKFLFKLNFLQALLYQQPSKQVVNGFSLGSILAKDEPERKSAEKKLKELLQEPVASKKVQLMRIGLHALTGELADKWSHFVVEAEALGADEQNKLSSIIYALGEGLDIIEMWLHTTFAETYGTVSNDNLINATFESIFDLSGDGTLDEIYKAATCLDHLKGSFKKLYEYKKKIDGLSLEGVADPSSFLKVWDYFYNQILKYFISPEFVADFKAAHDSGRKLENLFAISLMESLVKKFDDSIKLMENSKEKYNFIPENMQKNVKTILEDKNFKALINTEIKENKNRIFTFSFMLYYYFELLRVWYDVMCEVGLTLRGYGETPIKDVLNWSEDKVEPEVLPSGMPDIPQYTLGMLLLNASKNTSIKDGPKEIKSTPQFDVSSSKIGSGAAFGRIFPRKAGMFSVTLEDMFTTIHQSILNIIGKLIDAYGPADENFPEIMQVACRQIPKIINDNTIKIQDFYGEQPEAPVTPLAKMLKNGKLEVKFNYAQVLHSANIQVNYEKTRNKESKQAIENVKITFNTFGEDHYARFDCLDDIAEIWAKIYGLELISIKRQIKSIELCWLVQHKEGDPLRTFEKAIKNIARCIFFLSELEELREGRETVPFLLGEYYDHPLLRKEYLPDPLDETKAVSPDVIKKHVIEFSANPATRKNRIYWPLKEILLGEVYDLNKERNEFQTTKLFQFFDFNSVRGSLEQIGKRLGSLNTPYAINSKIYLYRQKFTASPGSNPNQKNRLLPEQFYGLTPKNFVRENVNGEGFDRAGEELTAIAEMIKSSKRVISAADEKIVAQIKSSKATIENESEINPKTVSILDLGLQYAHADNKVVQALALDLQNALGGFLQKVHLGGYENKWQEFDEFVNKSPDVSYEFAKKSIRSDSPNLQKLSMAIFKSLIQKPECKDQTIRDALDAAMLFVKSDEYIVKLKAIDLLNLLMYSCLKLSEHEEIYSKIVMVINDLVNNINSFDKMPDWDRKQLMFYLLIISEYLIERGEKTLIPKAKIVLEKSKAIPLNSPDDDWVSAQITRMSEFLSALN